MILKLKFQGNVCIWAMGHDSGVYCFPKSVSIPSLLTIYPIFMYKVVYTCYIKMFFTIGIIFCHHEWVIKIELLMLH
jgi:hypothetical protein